MLRFDMFDSPAWRHLPSEAQALWLHIRRRYNGTNNGEIPLSCREAAELLNISKNTASRAFERLIEHGFIKIGEDSDFRLKLRKSRRWIMTHEAYASRGPTNEWRDWKPPENLEHGVIGGTHSPTGGTVRTPMNR